MINLSHNIHINKFVEHFKNTGIIEKFNESSIFIKLIIIYIIYTFSKNLITGIISVIFYVALIAITTYYTYGYLENKK